MGTIFTAWPEELPIYCTIRDQIFGNTTHSKSSNKRVIKVINASSFPFESDAFKCTSFDDDYDLGDLDAITKRPHINRSLVSSFDFDPPAYRLHPNSGTFEAWS